jgi:hypothetical protein
MKGGGGEIVGQIFGKEKIELKMRIVKEKIYIGVLWVKLRTMGRLIDFDLV